MKIFLLLLSLLTILSVAKSQSPGDNNIVKDSVWAIINLHHQDTSEVLALAELAYLSDSPDSGVVYGNRGIAIAKTLKYTKGEAECLFAGITQFWNLQNINQSILYAFRALDLYENINDSRGAAETHLILQGIYRELGDYENALLHERLGMRLAEDKGSISKYMFPGHRLVPLFLAETATTYLEKNQIDSSRLFTQKAIEQEELFKGTRWNFPLYLLGEIQIKQARYQAALQSFREALPLAVSNDFPRDTLQIFNGISTLYLKTGRLDSAIYYARIVTTNRNLGEAEYVLKSIDNLASAYKASGQKDSAIKFMELLRTYEDSVHNSEKLMGIHNIAFDQKLKQQEITAAQLQYKEKLRMYALGAGFLVILLVAVLLWRHNKQRQSAYILLEKQKMETDHQKIKTEQALGELKATQTQLISSAKMASLGELTSGIAHEIQNPLNFVNNFSEVNKELLMEMKEEMNNGNLHEAKMIATTVVGNEEKIIYHGKRADSIVKAMLQHSKTSSNQKELTAINNLADEYLGIAYNGIRSKDKSFHASLQTDFDDNVREIPIIPQEIGRLLLNIYNNAFYAVAEKQKQSQEGYEPKISVSTKQIPGKVEIRVKDNGNGIPEKVMDKIFQPFFTTKPPGQGTGLGLSLGYDIVKAHGGELKVNTAEGAYTEFIIQLPI